MREKEENILREIKKSIKEYNDNYKEVSEHSHRGGYEFKGQVTYEFSFEEVMSVPDANYVANKIKNNINVPEDWHKRVDIMKAGVGRTATFKAIINFK